MQPLIRRYQAADLDAVIGVFLQSIREVASHDYDAGQIDAWAQADRAVWARRRLDRPTWVAVINATVVGFSDLKSSGHIDMLFVHPECQRKGVAAALLGEVERAARYQHVRALDTDASITARPFFEAHGFRVVRPQVVVLRGQRLTNFRMEKRLFAV
jgi:putative acetyltransferase